MEDDAFPSSEVAMMSAVPGFCAFTVPSFCTIAAWRFEDIHVTDEFVEVSDIVTTALSLTFDGPISWPTVSGEAGI